MYFWVCVCVWCIGSCLLELKEGVEYFRVGVIGFWELFDVGIEFGFFGEY